MNPALALVLLLASQDPAEVEVLGDRYGKLETLPASSSFLDSDELLRRRITNVQDLTAGAVPNLAATDSGTRSFGDVYSFRGLINGAFFSNPSAAVYVDDVP